jgi:hypothetical protein
MEKEIINKSQTISEAIQKLYGYYNGKTKKKFMDLVSEKNINISHLRAKALKYPIVTKTCPVCGKEFQTQIGNKGERTTCSYSCSNTYFRSGENNPNWGNYGDSNEKNGYRRICFEKHKKECIICGESKIVAVHHFDENRNNNNPENLIPLCPTHHQYIHSRYKDEVIDKVIEYRNKFIGI